ncbi:MAG: beta-L-arabinofuranosidase domain-containing protein [Bacteroidota bacterium]
MRKSFGLLLLCIACFFSDNISAQERLYSNQFSLADVQLGDGPFKHARDLNIETLLKYNTDRLLSPYLKEAGLIPKDSGYKNWDGLDGHVGGHYLSAMAMNVAATQNAECKKRMEYMLAELKKCQEANIVNHAGWGEGYVGGVPNSALIWTKLKAGDFNAYRAAWVPWYNLHKMYAGLRDAWAYTGNSIAKELFLKFCDWGINITAALSDEQMQEMLDTEQGGMNEVFADAYQVTGDNKYLVAAKRFSHRMLLEPLSKNIDNLDNKHANTQVPKAIGFQRIGELSGDAGYQNAGRFFWETVTNNRTLAFGGNSRREFFPAMSAAADFIDDVEGPESCNSYNMLKLTESLFRINPSVKYIDYYEKTVYNHILSTQHPVHGGYVYFTPARPRHYRVYSAPNEAMWCCVGSGMENHGKYNEFIYTHQHDSLFLQLFIASELNWKEKKISIKQETNFPFEAQTKLTITGGNALFNLMVRYPSWVSDGKLQVLVNGKPIKIQAKPASFLTIKRLWKKGDVVEIKLPMHHTIEQLPNLPSYIALMHGPILLGAKTGKENMQGLVANDSRWGHIAGGKKLPVSKAPILLQQNVSAIVKALQPVNNQPLKFITPGVKMANPVDAVFEPFFKIHDSRYMMYWKTLTDNQYKSYLDSITAVENERLALDAITIDFVAAGEQQPEADHGMEWKKSAGGVFHEEFYRNAFDSGYFSYNLATKGQTDISLSVRYYGDETGIRKFDIYIDDQKLATESLGGKWKDQKFHNVSYSIPAEMLQGKEKIKVKFQALPKTATGGIYYIRLLKKAP